MSQGSVKPNGTAACQRVHVHTEWGPLREVIVGIAHGAQVPRCKDASLHAIDYGALSDEEFAQVPCGPFPQNVIDESNEDLDQMAADLQKMGVRVHRPPQTDFAAITATANWKVDGYHAYCPRDTILTVGNEAIETPMAMRHRQTEARIYRDVVQTFRAPVPRLLDGIYDRSVLGVPTLRNDEPVFDAANCLKIGRDIMFLIANTGNLAGANWLQQHLGSEYRVHPVRDVYAFVHIDSTIVPLRPGLVLLCPTRVNDNNLPKFFQSWDKIYAPEPVDTPGDPVWVRASKWIALNCLSVAPDLIFVEKRQIGLMREFARYGIESHPVQLRHARTLGGGPHCVTLDLVRDESLEDYS